MDNALLSILIFLPLAGCLCLIPFRHADPGARWIALLFALAELGLAASALRSVPPPGSMELPGFFLWQDLPWIEYFGIRYIVGMDGISYLLVLLTAFLTVIAVAVSWRGIRERVPLFFFTLLLMESGIVGVFLALDLFLFYLFWELMLIPMFLLIGIWGHGRRIYSAVKFFLYTLAGSLLLLLAIIALYLAHGRQTGIYSFSFPELLNTPLPPALSLSLFAAFLLAFAIKVPLFPVHTWLPDAHTDAPTAGSVILAGLLLKTGAYGLIRFAVPLFPHAASAAKPLLFAVALIGIVYGSWIAYAQTDMKRLVAYSSVGHMGFVALGITAWTPVALSGGILQMINHGITTGALFAMTGMLDERAGTRETASFGGIWGKIPAFAFFFLFFSMASAGLPGLNNFAGEFLILAGTFRTSPLPAAIALAGIILPLVYTIRLVQELLFGTERRHLTLSEISLREGAVLAALAILALYLGTHPAPVLDLLKTPVGALIAANGVFP